MFKDRDKYVSGEFRWVWLPPVLVGVRGDPKRGEMSSANSALIGWESLLCFISLNEDFVMDIAKATQEKWWRHGLKKKWGI